MYCDWPEFGRCCFCLPLRKGVIIFGYASILYSSLMIGLHSFSIQNPGKEVVSYGAVVELPAELSIATYCVEVIFDVILIYGAHKKLPILIKSYYYFALTTSIAVIVLQVVSLAISKEFYVDTALEMMIFSLAGFCMQLYLIAIIRSLLKRMEISGPHAYDNQLHQIATGEFKAEVNSDYNNTAVPEEA